MEEANEPDKGGERDRKRRVREGEGRVGGESGGKKR